MGNATVNHSAVPFWKWRDERYGDMGDRLHGKAQRMGKSMDRRWNEEGQQADGQGDDAAVTYEAGEATPERSADGEGRKGLSAKAKGVITAVIVILYLLLPADVIPDAMLGLGQIDDAIVFAVGLIGILSRLMGPKR